LLPPKSEVFDQYGRYYDLLYQDKDYDAEVEYVRQLLMRLGVTQGSLLEFGAGTGRHGRLLAGAGYDVLGVDQSETMVERARSLAMPGFSVERGDIRTIRFDRTFDVVAALFHVVSYQSENADVLSVFQNARTHLLCGGIFIFDVWYGPAVHALRPSAREKHVEDQVISITRLAEPSWDVNRNQVKVNYTVRIVRNETGALSEFKETHPMRYFTLPELDFFATQSGFEREVAEEFLSGASPSERTWSVCLALRAT
jgi:SAM-dependent methyltransferase